MMVGTYRRWTLAMAGMVTVASTALVPIGVAARAGAAASAAATDVWALRAGGVSGPEGNFGATTAQPCSGLDATECMLPFPDDFYTRADPSTVTGRQVAIPAGAFPAAVGQGPLSPVPYEQNDGFSPGATILLHVQGLGLAQSRMATDSDIGASMTTDSPVVLLDATTGQRWPTWVELDVADHDPDTRLLMIHPAKNLTEGNRYIVALRDLKNTSGITLHAPADFAAQVLGGHGPAADNVGVPQPLAAHLRSVVAQLGQDKISTANLYLAWDFTVISEESLTQPAVTMRDEAFAQLGQAAPAFTVTKVVDDPSDKKDLSREVSGTFDVPSFLNGTPGKPGSEMTTGANGLPVIEPGAVDHADFVCEIPKSASTAHPATVGVYGHGLFNDATEVFASGVPGYSDTFDTVFCGTDWSGLSKSTLAFAVGILSNLNDFPSLVDNLMQSLLNAQFLGRLLDSPMGFATSPAFQGPAGHPLISTGHGIVYYGNSLGGIMGGSFTALDTDDTRSVLGVVGMDFDVLLNRSVDFSLYLGFMTKYYPRRDVQQLGFALAQMLWDRGEGDGYAEQMTSSPLPGTHPHQVLLEEAFGDHQVANVETATEARTIGAAVYEPALAPGRSNEAEPFWGIPTLRPDSHGSALFVWDSGVPAPPLTDTTPRVGHDPHDTVPRDEPSFWTQMHTFFTTGVVADPCGGKPCRAPYPPTPWNQ